MLSNKPSVHSIIWNVLSIFKLDRFLDNFFQSDIHVNLGIIFEKGDSADPNNKENILTRKAPRRYRP